MISRVISSVLLTVLLSCGALVAMPAMGIAQEISPQAKNAQDVISSKNQPTHVQIDTANLALPNAEEIIIDVPSAFHATRYQSGEANGLRYVLFPDGTGKVMQASASPTAEYELDCRKAIYCSVTGHGQNSNVVPRAAGTKLTIPTSPDALELASFLAEWVLDQTAPPQQETPIVAVETVEEADTEVQLAQQKPVVESVDLAVTKRAQAKPHNIAKVALSLASPRLPIRKQATQDQVTSREKVKPLARPVRKVAVQSSAFSSPSIQVVARAKQEINTAKPRETFFQRLKPKCSITGSVTLRYKNHNTGAKRFGKPRTNLGCGVRLSDKLTLRVSAIGYWDNDEKSPDDAEFTYALTHRTTDKLTFTYSNYSGRVSDSGSAFVDSLTTGSLRASYRLPKVKLPNETTIGCSVGIGLAKVKENRASLSCSYALTKKIRISGTAFAYFPGQQDPWDADFSYTASYRINEDWSVSYSNYSNNRFFWNEGNGQGDGILGGSVSMTYRFDF